MEIKRSRVHGNYLLLKDYSFFFLVVPKNGKEVN
jgi:hypothetical protein